MSFWVIYRAQILIFLCLFKVMGYGIKLLIHFFFLTNISGKIQRM